FFKIENIVKFSKVSELKLKPLRKIEFDSNFSQLNNLIKNKKDASDKYFFVTNNGRWTGFIDENILKTVSIRKWERNFVGDFKKPIDSFKSVHSNDKLWKTIERLEETSEGFILVLNAADIPLGIIDRSKIGNFVLNKLGFNLPSEIVNKLNNKNHYPLGIELPRIINSMKQKGDL
ncbi:Zn-dependent protease, partial [bacterium]|nr:Zn-dependent protease [bacterium]